jgi:hypothetical protein
MSDNGNNTLGLMALAGAIAWTTLCGFVSAIFLAGCVYWGRWAYDMWNWKPSPGERWPQNPLKSSRW